MSYNRTPRRRFTDQQRTRFFAEHDGVCYLCGEKIDGVREKWEIEHRIAREIMGEGADEDGNLELVHQSCHAQKTKLDRQAIAKSNAVQAKHIGAHRPKHKLQSRNSFRPAPSNARDIRADIEEAPDA